MVRTNFPQLSLIFFRRSELSISALNKRRNFFIIELYLAFLNYAQHLFTSNASSWRSAISRLFLIMYVGTTLASLGSFSLISARNWKIHFLDFIIVDVVNLLLRLTSQLLKSILSKNAFSWSVYWSVCYTTISSRFVIIYNWIQVKTYIVTRKTQNLFVFTFSFLNQRYFMTDRWFFRLSRDTSWKRQFFHDILGINYLAVNKLI